MGQQEAETVDAVVFFDVNMPKMHGCSSNCRNRSRDENLILCKHRLKFSAHLLHLGRLVEGYNDFRVVEACFNWLKKYGQKDFPGATFFAISTKDVNFLEKDVMPHYFDAVQDKTTDLRLVFGKDWVYYAAEDQKIFIVTVNCKNYGTRSHHDLRCVIFKLNELWERERQTS